MSLTSYLKFLIKSTNQHGVHSPFVYNLITRCFYNKQKNARYDSLNKKQKFVLRIIDYFQPKTTWVVNPVFPVEENFTETFDFIYFQKPDLERFEKLLTTRTNDSVWIIEAIHKNPENERIWQKIKHNETVTVTVDTFVYGLVFFRNEQAKEHFIIRV